MWHSFNYTNELDTDYEFENMYLLKQSGFKDSIIIIY